ncbi:hypothetical protein CL657_05325 [bacterium]|nr:hypothetical protein [bacterium]
MTQTHYFRTLIVMKSLAVCIYIISFIIVLNNYLQAIVHIDSFRGDQPLGLSQTASLTLDFLTGNTKVLRFQPEYYIAYRLNSQLKKEWFCIANKRYSKNQDTIIQDNSFSHLRYIAYINTKLRYDVFFQNESNRFTALSQRWLLGTASGIDIINQKNHQYTINLGLMLEAETLLNTNKNQVYRITHSHHYNYTVLDRFSLFLTSYFQPALHDWTDIRALLQSTLQWKLIDPLHFSISVSADYDSGVSSEIKPYDIAFKQYLSFHY